jgi:hypothetical protein
MAQAAVAELDYKVKDPAVMDSIHHGTVVGLQEAVD